MNFISKIDRYAPKIELNLDGQTYQKSIFGGIVSLISYVVVFAYGVSLFNKLVNRLDPTISTYDIITDLRKVGNVTANEINFDMAIQFQSQVDFSDIPFEEAETYFTVEFNQTFVTNYDYQKSEKIPIQNPFTSCFDEVDGKRPFKFIDKESLKKNLALGSKCIDTSSLIFQNDASYDNVTFLRVSISNCIPQSLKGKNKTCKTQDQLTQFIKQKRPTFNVYTGRNFIDASDFDKPIKTVIDSQSIEPIELTTVEEFTAIQTLIQVVDLTLLDQPFRPFYNKQNKLSIVNSKQATNNFPGGKSKRYGDILFFLNDQRTIYNRQVFGIMDLLGSLGGLSTVVFAIGSILVSQYASTDQKFTLVKNVYSVRESQKNTDISKLIGKKLEQSDLEILETTIKASKLKKSISLFLTVMFSNCLKRLLRNRKQVKLRQLENGIKKLERALDIKALVRTKTRLRILEKILFTSPQIALLRMNYSNYLGDSSDASSSLEDDIKIGSLLSYQAQNQLDFSLMQGVQKPSFKQQIDQDKTSLSDYSLQAVQDLQTQKVPAKPRKNHQVQKRAQQNIYRFDLFQPQSTIK